MHLVLDRKNREFAHQRVHISNFDYDLMAGHDWRWRVITASPAGAVETAGIMKGIQEKAGYLAVLAPELLREATPMILQKVMDELT